MWFNKNFVATFLNFVKFVARTLFGKMCFANVRYVLSAKNLPLLQNQRHLYIKRKY